MSVVWFYFIYGSLGTEQLKYNSNLSNYFFCSLLFRDQVPYSSHLVLIAPRVWISLVQNPWITVTRQFDIKLVSPILFYLSSYFIQLYSDCVFVFCRLVDIYTIWLLEKLVLFIFLLVRVIQGEDTVRLGIADKLALGLPNHS